MLQSNKYLILGSEILLVCLSSVFSLQCKCPSVWPERQTAVGSPYQFLTPYKSSLLYKDKAKLTYHHQNCQEYVFVQAPDKARSRKRGNLLPYCFPQSFFWLILSCTPVTRQNILNLSAISNVFGPLQKWCFDECCPNELVPNHSGEKNVYQRDGN